MKTTHIVTIASVSAVILLGLIFLTNGANTDSQLAAQSASLQSTSRPVQGTSQSSSVISPEDICKYLKSISQKAYDDCIQQLKNMNFQSHPVVSTLIDQYVGKCSSNNVCTPSFGECDKNDCMREFQDGRCWYRPSAINGKLQSTNTCFTYFVPCKDRKVECTIKTDSCSPKSEVVLTTSLVSGNGQGSTVTEAQENAYDDLLTNGQADCNAKKPTSNSVCDAGCTQKGDAQATFTPSTVTYTDVSIKGSKVIKYRAETELRGICTLVRTCVKN